jgi:hypothetical protein
MMTSFGTWDISHHVEFSSRWPILCGEICLFVPSAFWIPIRTDWALKELSFLGHVIIDEPEGAVVWYCDSSFSTVLSTPSAPSMFVILIPDVASRFELFGKYVHFYSRFILLGCLHLPSHM